MDITNLIDEFVKKNQRNRNKVYFKICKNVLLGSRPYSLNSQRGFSESEYLPANIKTSVTIYSSNKDTVIAMYKDLVAFLKSKGVDVPDVSFPPIPVSNSFDAHLNPSYVGNIINFKKNNPSRDALICIAFALSASEEELQYLLKYAGHAPLYVRRKRDVIIWYGIMKGESLETVNDNLLARGLKPLFKE